MNALHDCRRQPRICLVSLIIPSTPKGVAKRQNDAIKLSTATSHITSTDLQCQDTMQIITTGLLYITIY